MSGYAVVLFLHLLSLLFATAAAALAGFAALRLRNSASAAEAGQWGRLIHRVVPVFPLASIGMLASGGYLTQQRWAWSTPWVVAGLVGLGLIAFLGSGIEARRGRALQRELQAAGMSPRARRLMRDPAAWSAKVTTWTVMLAVVFVMTTKPAAVGAAAAILLAVVCGPLLAVPFWRQPALVAAGVGTVASTE